jgi:hypothetical protein
MVTKPSGERLAQLRAPFMAAATSEKFIEFGVQLSNSVVELLATSLRRPRDYIDPEFVAGLTAEELAFFAGTLRDEMMVAALSNAAATIVNTNVTGGPANLATAMARAVKFGERTMQVTEQLNRMDGVSTRSVERTVN